MISHDVNGGGSSSHFDISNAEAEIHVHENLLLNVEVESGIVGADNFLFRKDEKLELGSLLNLDQGKSEALRELQC